MKKCYLFLSFFIISIYSPFLLALSIELNDIGGAAAGTAAGDGFIEAAKIWESLLIDPVNISLDVGFSTLDAGVLGTTRSNYQTLPYADIRDALIKKNESKVDNILTANLQMTDSLKFMTNDAKGNIVVDENGTANNLYMAVTTANLKALGLLPSATQADAEITFSDAFNFDFNQNDGIDRNTYDFVAVAVHEIGHALGFVSGVDTLDYYSGKGPGASQNINFNQYAVINPLDLFRYSSTSLAKGAGVLDFAVGDRGQYFSLDGGKTKIAELSSGVYNGDGSQASHWKDHADIGLLDPTLSPGLKGVLTSSDLIALDSIGFNLKTPITDFPGANTGLNVTTVSAPQSLLCFLFGLCAIMLFSSRNARHHACAKGQTAIHSPTF